MNEMNSMFNNEDKTGLNSCGKIPPSIFNDVLGPVMRGPSSSHTAASYRIGDVVRKSLGGTPSRVVFDFDINGSLAATHEGQGSDMGLVCGLCGKPLTEEGAENYEVLAADQGLECVYNICDYGAVHPNNFKIIATRGEMTRRWQAISTGGGMFEMYELDGFAVSVKGDFFELLAKFADDADCAKANALADVSPRPEFRTVSANGATSLLSLKYSSSEAAESAKAAASRTDADIIFIEPILPTLSRAGCAVPFVTASGALEYAAANGLSAWELAAEYEAARGGISREEVLSAADALVSVMERSLDEGLAGTEYEDRILGRQSHLIAEAAASGKIIPGDVMNNIITSVAAIMEAKSAMHVIVAAPTAGSCGCLPGALIGASRTLGKPRGELVRAMLAAGLVGVFIAESATFAAEVAGCEVECGAGGGMAAAGLACLMGGTPYECFSAASMSLQNVTGLACDMAADRVEVPCLGKNIMCALGAAASANMALSGFDCVIPLDETIAALYDAGRALPAELRCTFGGLGKCPTSRKIHERLKANKTAGK